MRGHTCSELLKYHVMFKEHKLLKYPYAYEVELLVYRFSYFKKELTNSGTRTFIAIKRFIQKLNKSIII